MHVAGPDTRPGRDAVSGDGRSVLRAPGDALTGSTPRCFLAVPVEEPALAAAASLLAALRTEFPGVRWVRPSGLHLTVHFFGPLPDALWDAVTETVAPCAAATAPFTVRLDTLGAFPAGGAPRVLWLGASAGHEAAISLALACRGALSAAGVEVESRPPALHCTLGRPRDAWDAGRRRSWAGRTASLPAWTARRLVLYESLPGPGGSTYVPRREAALAGAG
ncbi:MAG TPA: RNA 2',3'-cyclic phosphodiesterase [Candidatus Dormibacteraeota bacterium]|nr:RNA 2',3'-cyclic phosphodiesterase [Candidatus Dormibacteraeota bacterium]